MQKTAHKQNTYQIHLLVSLLCMLLILTGCMLCISHRPSVSIVSTQQAGIIGFLPPVQPTPTPDPFA